MSLWGDFIRGYFDGNGSVSVNLNVGVGIIQSKIRGPTEILKYIKSNLDVCNISSSLNCEDGKNRKIYFLTMGRKDSVKFYEKIYNGGMCLERKKMKFERYINFKAGQATSGGDLNAS
jgi:hypothetical protein